MIFLQCFTQHIGVASGMAENIIIFPIVIPKIWSIRSKIIFYIDFAYFHRTSTRLYPVSENNYTIKHTRFQPIKSPCVCYIEARDGYLPKPRSGPPRQGVATLSRSRANRDKPSKADAIPFSDSRIFLFYFKFLGARDGYPAYEKNRRGACSFCLERETGICRNPVPGSPRQGVAALARTATGLQ